MGCAKKVALLSFSALAAAAILLCFTLRTSDVRIATTETTPVVNSNPSQTSFSGELTHRDAGHLQNASQGSPFFSWHEASNQIQAQRAYWEHLMGRTAGGHARRQLLGTAVQTLPINGSLENGNYFVQMQLGTPAQNITMLIDSGSSLFWVECNDCADCTGLTEQSPFVPTATSTLTTPSCGACQDYEYGLCGTSQDATDPTPYDPCFVLCAANEKQCYYGYSYGDGSQTGGYIQKDVLTVPSTNSTAITANVSFGCNYLSGVPSDPTVTPLVVGPQISGLIGLSKGNYSALNQMAAQNLLAPVFSFCLAGVTGGGLFVMGNRTQTAPGIQYIPMGSHPEYYNATITSISVNNQLLNIPASVFYQPEVLTRFEAPDPYYLPDAIFDSGTSFTILADQAYQVLAQSLQTNTPSLYRPVEIDSSGYIIDIVTAPPSPPTAASPPTSGLVPAPVRRNSSASGSLCFEVPLSQISRDGSFDVSAFPNITFAFSGATLTTGPNDYLFVYEATDQLGRGSAILACPTFISDGGQGYTILGEYTMRNHYMQFDIQARRIGIAPANCTTFR